VLQLQQQFQDASQQLSLAKQRAKDGDALAEALRDDITRLQDQLRQRDADAISTAGRAAAAAAAAVAADAAAAQLRCDLLVADAREDALKQRVDTANQRMKACEKDLNAMSVKNASLLLEIENLKAANEEQSRAEKECSERHQVHILKLQEEIENERSRGSKLAAVVSTVTATSTTDLECLKKELSAARSSAISDQEQISQLRASALVLDKKMRDSADLQARLQQEVISTSHHARIHFTVHASLVSRLISCSGTLLLFQMTLLHKFNT
jgi:hypothetical protein